MATKTKRRRTKGRQMQVRKQRAAPQRPWWLYAGGAAAVVTLAVALATRLVPTLERDAAGLTESLRGRGVEVSGVRGRARLLTPLLAGSLERALNLAEAMEARGYGRPGATRALRPGWRARDRAALAVGAALVVIGALWL